MTKTNYVNRKKKMFTVKQINQRKVHNVPTSEGNKDYNHVH